MVEKRLFDVAEKALIMLKREGAEKATCASALNRTTELNVNNGEFTLLRTLFSRSLMISAHVDGKRGSASMNDFDDESLERAVKECIEAAHAAQSDPAWDISDSSNGGSFKDGDLEADMDALYERTEELLNTIAKEYPKVTVEQLIVTHVNSQSIVMNTNGVKFDFERGQYGVSLSMCGVDGDEVSSLVGGGVMTADLSRPFIDIGSLRYDISSVEKQIHTKPLEGKFEGTVIFTPDCFGSLLYTALSGFAGEASMINGTAIWKDKLGCRVMHPGLTVSFAPWDERIVCGQRMTGDGYNARDFEMITGGVLNGFILSNYGANKTGHRRSPNTSSAMIVSPGDLSFDELISGTEKGIIVGRFSGGAPSANGDFSGVAKNSFLVEKGEITCALRETMVSGNLERMFNDLKGLTRDCVCDGTAVLPWAAFGGITIAGK